MRTTLKGRTTKIAGVKILGFNQDEAKIKAEAKLNALGSAKGKNKNAK
ncbi:hypothetical protein ES706_06731 [subsurface metagenome]